MRFWGDGIGVKKVGGNHNGVRVYWYVICISEVADGRVDSIGRWQMFLVLQALDRRSYEVLD